MTISRVLVLGASVICVVLATAGAALPFGAALIPLGLTFLAASMLV